MASSTSDIKTSSKRPGQSGTPVMVRFQPDLLDALDRFAAEHDAIGRPEAVRLLLRGALVGQGYLKAYDSPKDTFS